MTDNVLIHLNNVTKHFEDDGRKVPVLKDIDLDVQRGEFLMLLGPSGSGKSTLLRLLSGLEKPDSGTLHMGVTSHSFVFQDFALFPWLTVAENIGFGLKMKGRSESEITAVVKDLVSEMGLDGFLHAYPRELSGGMKQRVGIARALAMSPEVMFLDEPFSALDTFTEVKLRLEVLKIWETRKITMVMVTHSVEEALFMADRIAVFSERPATISNIVKNPFPRPRNVHSAEFVRKVEEISNLVE